MPRVINLGCGILLEVYDEWEVGATEKDTPPGYTRFLDHLLLPASLDKLTRDQIFIVNRYREQQLETDPQYRHRNAVRRALVRTLQEIGAKDLIEFGCGKFPLANEITGIRYVAIEIDPEAIRHLETIPVHHADDQDLHIALGTFDTSVALYAFHFQVTDRELDLLTTALSPSGIAIFNVVAEGTATALSVATRLSLRGMAAFLIRGGNLARKETFFIMAREAAISKAAKAAELLRLEFHCS